MIDKREIQDRVNRRLSGLDASERRRTRIRAAISAERKDSRSVKRMVPKPLGIALVAVIMIATVAIAEHFNLFNLFGMRDDRYNTVVPSATLTVTEPEEAAHPEPEAATAPVDSASFDKLRIIVTSKYEARNWPAEEAFFALRPGTEIEYVLVTEDQLSARLQSGTLEGDLVILPYRILKEIAEKGYLRDLDEGAGLTGYPQQLMDLSDLLTRDGKVFALPVRLTQDFWTWNTDLGDALGLKPPEGNTWSWNDLAELAEHFPVDADGDGAFEVYLMSGESAPAYPGLKKANLGMLFQYVTDHGDFGSFRENHLDLFRKLVVHDSLYDFLDPPAENCKTLIGRFSFDNPIVFMDEEQLIDDEKQCFLPPPTLDGEEGPYPGYLWACGMLTDASSPELAADFIRAMLSEDALSGGTGTCYDQLVSATRPELAYSDDRHLYDVEFVSSGNLPVYRVSAGRTFSPVEFPFSEEAFQKSLRFRTLLKVNTTPFGSGFYNSMYSALQEWLDGHIDDAGLTDRMNDLLESAESSR